MSRLRVWCAGASIGYLVGWLAGSNVLKMAEGRRLGRPEPRTALSAPVESPETLNVRENGAQRIPTQREGVLDVGDLHDRPDYQEALRRAEGMPWEPTVDLTEWLDENAPCVQRSPGGGLVCYQKGAHHAHMFAGSCAPDRKDDDDTKVDL